MADLLKLIIADDEEFMRENLARLFPWKELGYDVCAVCADGAAAFDSLIKLQADVVLTDIQMPGWSGIDLAEAVWKQNLDAAIVFLSAYSDFDYARQGIRYGVIDYLIKPVRCQELSQLFLRLKADIRHSRQESASSPTAEELILKKVSDYIRLAPALATIEACATETGLAVEYLSALVKKQKKMTFTEFAYQERMILAGELLRNIGLQINVVAEMTGYTNAKNFSRAFHNYYSITPMQYRKQRGSRDETSDYRR